MHLLTSYVPALTCHVIHIYKYNNFAHLLTFSGKMYQPLSQLVEVNDISTAHQQGQTAKYTSTGRSASWGIPEIFGYLEKSHIWWLRKSESYCTFMIQISTSFFKHLSEYLKVVVKGTLHLVLEGWELKANHQVL